LLVLKKFRAQRYGVFSGCANNFEKNLFVNTKNDTFAVVNINKHCYEIHKRDGKCFSGRENHRGADGDS
jgi:hypothetical protein